MQNSNKAVKHQLGERVVTERDTVVYTIEKGLIRKITFL